MAIANGGIGLDSPPLDRINRCFADDRVSAYIVGGYLRDTLRDRSNAGVTHHDLDLAVDGNPEPIARSLADYLGGSVAPLDRTRGIFRVTAPVENDSGDRQLYSIDLTSFSESIEEDLARRDFSVDAIALHWDDRQRSDWPVRVIDPFGGRRDLVQKRIRAISPTIFRDDPGRLLRSVRLTSQLGFALDPGTANLVRQQAHLLSRVSAERQRDEFLGILSLANAKRYLVILDRLDLLCRLIPELEATKGVEQPVVHYWDVWEHMLHCVEAAEDITGGHQNSPVFIFAPWTPDTAGYFGENISDGHSRRTILKLAALFHDIAKPQTKATDETGKTRFLGHSELGASMAERRLTQLRLGSRAVGMVRDMVTHHLRPGNMSREGEQPTPRAIHRYFRDLNGVAVDTLFLALADYLAAKGPNLVMEQWSAHARMIGRVLECGLEQQRPQGPSRLVTGHDLMEHLSLEPGPLVGEILTAVTEAHASGEIHTREEALALAEQTASDGPARE